MGKVFNDAPILIGGTTQSQSNEQGVTYNQAGYTYNQAGITYGGVYKLNQDVVPVVSLAEQLAPVLMGGTTQAQVEEQGYTYNQAGFSYNQIGIMYGGIFNQNQDFAPILSLAENIRPSIYGYNDIYTQGGTVIPPSNSGMLMGILGLTYP